MESMCKLVLSPTNSSPLETITDRCKNCYQPENCVVHIILREDDVFYSFFELRLHGCCMGDCTTKITGPKYLVKAKMSNNLDAADCTLDIDKNHWI